MNLNKYIDHTNLYPTATNADIKKLCQEALKYDFISVCVHPCYVSLCRKELKNSKVKVCTVIGFPFGNNTTVVKKAEIEDAVLLGADEIDFVVNLSAVKNKNWVDVAEEMLEIKNSYEDSISKVILETCLLNKDEIIKLCEIADKTGIEFVKTSTGFSTHGATLEAVKIMKDHISNKTQIKASGGIKTLAHAKAFIAAGANRIGTSNGVLIMEEYYKNK